MKAPNPTRQLAFHQLLVGARKTWLTDALREAVKAVDQKVLKAQLGDYAPADAQTILAGAGIRDEEVFPVPVVLEEKPTLVGYYRLLLGIPQKSFYTTETGFAGFKRMEEDGVLTDRRRELLPEFCRTMAEPLAELVRQLSPAVTPRDVSELPLLTLGSKFQGANNNQIGQRATHDVFLAIAEVVETHVTDRDAQSLTIVNAAHRTVRIVLAADPDVRIQEEFGDELRNKVAVEIKGGTDKSNAHNRAGEAEKSHQKAKAEDYTLFWTVIAKKGLNMETLRAESPTTTSWFDVAQVLGRDGDDWKEFRSRIAGEVGIPLPEE
jgi:hypothetical protein